MTDLSRLVRINENNAYFSQVKNIILEILGSDSTILENNKDLASKTIFQILLKTEDPSLVLTVYVCCIEPYQNGGKIRVTLTSSEYTKSYIMEDYCTLSNLPQLLTYVKNRALLLQKS